MKGVSMNLIKNQWTKDDIKPFLAYLKTFQNKEKEAWARKILNTKLDLLVIPSKRLGEITREIAKGNLKSYLDLEIFDFYEGIAIYGILLTKIPDFDDMLPYLTKYLHVMENWAHCDLLSLPITPQNRNRFLELSDAYLHDSRVFVRRLSLMILFQMIKDEDILEIIFDHLLELKTEQAYYVIMMAGWLLCECILLYKDTTLAFIQSNPSLNAKIVNKGIQKCRESRRLTPLEKDQLLVYKRNRKQA